MAKRTFTTHVVRYVSMVYSYRQWITVSYDKGMIKEAERWTCLAKRKHSLWFRTCVHSFWMTGYSCTKSYQLSMCIVTDWRHWIEAKHVISNKSNKVSEYEIWY